jgi:hypothetical protein
VLLRVRHTGNQDRDADEPSLQMHWVFLETVPVANTLQANSMA